MTLDLTKPVQTRDGRGVRILATDVKGDFPIVGVATDSNGTESVLTFTANGKYFTETRAEDISDLVNVPSKREKVYLNLGEGYSNLSAAQSADKSWAVVEVNLIDGKPDVTILHREAWQQITA